MPPFWLSIGLLSLVQGVLVALPGDGRAMLERVPWIARRHSRLWAAIPPLSVVVFVFVAQAAERASAQSLTYLALVAVPLLAALALGWLGRGARVVLARSPRPCSRSRGPIAPGWRARPPRWRSPRSAASRSGCCSPR